MQMVVESKKNIVVVVAHPDDESLWIGGTLAGLSRSGICNVYIISMTGRTDLVRNAEFRQAMEIIQPESSLLMCQDIPKQWGTDLQYIERDITDSINEFGLKSTEINLLITHSYYGDEHQHPNHKQLFVEAGEYASARKIPFAFFSFMPIPNLLLNPVLTDGRRDFGLHLICAAECIPSKVPGDCSLVGQTPAYFLQFKVDHGLKKKMLHCYKSINIAQHQSGYSAWDSDIECLYVDDKNGFDCLMAVYRKMSRPHATGNRIF